MVKDVPQQGEDAVDAIRLLLLRKEARIMIDGRLRRIVVVTALVGMANAW